jgi:hypothetical protein
MIETEAREHERWLAESGGRALATMEDATWALVALAYARAGCQETRGANLDDSTPSRQGGRPGVSSPLVTARWPELAAEPHRPLPSPGGGTATGCPTAQPAGWGTGIGTGRRVSWSFWSS